MWKRHWKMPTDSRHAIQYIRRKTTWQEVAAVRSASRGPACCSQGSRQVIDRSPEMQVPMSSRRVKQYQAAPRPVGRSNLVPSLGSVGGFHLLTNAEVGWLKVSPTFLMLDLQTRLLERLHHQSKFLILQCHWKFHTSQTGKPPPLLRTAGRTNKQATLAGRRIPCGLHREATRRPKALARPARALCGPTGEPGSQKGALCVCVCVCVCVRACACVPRTDLTQPIVQSTGEDAMHAHLTHGGSMHAPRRIGCYIRAWPGSARRASGMG